MTANQPKKSIKKRIILALAAVVGVVAISVTSVLATVAYLTSSAAVSNVFTIGNVGIVMTESKVNTDGTLYDDGQTKVDTNTYHLVNNKTYIKDPKITVNAGSTPSYLFVLVRNDIETIECKENSHNHPTIAQQLAANGWMKYKTANTGWVYVYVGFNETTNEQGEVVEKSKVPTGNAAVTAGSYNFATALGDIVPSTVGSNETEVYKLFDAFTIAAVADLNPFGAAKVTLTAVAIQTDGFGTGSAAVEAAWAAVVNTYPYIHDGDVENAQQGSGNQGSGNQGNPSDSTGN